MDDPRRILDAAAEARAAVEILPRQGSAGAQSALRGQVVRIERGGVVVAASGPLASGVDLRCWMTVAGRSYTFEASVLRAGVSVPDRSQHGVLLGFVDGFRPADGEAGRLVLEVVAPGGGSASLTEGDVRIVELQPEEWTISAPTAFRLVFVEGGAVRLRIATPDRAPLEVGATVRAIAHGPGHLLYRLGIGSVADADAYRQVVAAVRGLLGI
jgi:hypothetical protein